MDRRSYSFPLCKSSLKCTLKARGPSSSYRWRGSTRSSKSSISRA